MARKILPDLIPVSFFAFHATDTVIVTVPNLVHFRQPNTRHCNDPGALVFRQFGLNKRIDWIGFRVLLFEADCPVDLLFGKLKSEYLGVRLQLKPGVYAGLPFSIPAYTVRRLGH